MLILDGHKLNYHADRIAAWQRGERIAPITIDMALTRVCTYNCQYCYSQLQYNPSKELTWSILSRFLDDCAEIGVKAISLVSDGESTCHRDWVDFIIAGKFRRINMALGTNGFLITEEDLKRALPYLTYMRFNISAVGSYAYSKIHGCDKSCYEKVIDNIKNAVRIKKENNLNVTIGLQMVLWKNLSQIIPLAKLGKELGIDYFVIKHCSDDESNTLKSINVLDEDLKYYLNAAERLSSKDYQVSVKWSKIFSKGRLYTHCYGPPFIMQLSGSGLVAPCGMLFAEKYKKYHIGNIANTSFKELWQSDKYWEVMRLLEEEHDSKTMCGSLCLQHKVNEYLNTIENCKPQHVNFI